MFYLINPLSQWKPCDYPLTPFVRITDGNGYTSPHLMNDKEIDEEIEKLGCMIADIRKKAKRELRVIKEKILLSLQAP